MPLSIGEDHWVQVWIKLDKKLELVPVIVIGTTYFWISNFPAIFLKVSIFELFSSLTRESSLPKSSLLVKKSDASMPEKSNRIKIKTTPLLSRERVDKAIETLKKSSRQNSPQIYPRVRLPKLNRSESLAPLRKSIDFPNYSGPQ